MPPFVRVREIDTPGVMSIVVLVTSACVNLSSDQRRFTVRCQPSS